MDAVGSFSSLISALFKVLIDRLAPDKMFKSLIGRDSIVIQLLNLRSLMMDICEMINDAGKKQLQHPADSPVKSFLDEVDDALYDAEDLIDQIHRETPQRHKTQADNESSFSSQGDGLQRSDSPDRLQKKINLKIEIERICHRFEEFALRMGVLVQTASQTQQQQQQHQSDQASSSRLRSSPSKGFTIYGRDSEREKIIQALQDGGREEDCDQREQGNQSKIRVVAIVGECGIGKTTLAQSIFIDPTVGEMFDFKVWNCVSEAFDIFQIRKSILSLLPLPSSTACLRFPLSPNENLPSVEMIQESLHERIAGKRLLIVLDDVWGKDLNSSWQTLLLSLRSAAKGSTIVVTTRDKDIARMFHPVLTLDLHPLSDDDCWSLAKEHMTGDVLDILNAKQLQPLGRQLAAAKCKGLPLAAKHLGYYLRSISYAEPCKTRQQRVVIEFPYWICLPVFTRPFIPWNRLKLFMYLSRRRKWLTHPGPFPLLQDTEPLPCLKKIHVKNVPKIRHSQIHIEPPRYRMLSQTNLQDLKLQSKQTNFMKGKLESVVSQSETSAYNLQNKEYVGELGRIHDGAEKARLIPTALKPGTILRRLTIKSFPDWARSCAFVGLVTLHLCNCINCISLPPLGEIPSLVHLCVKNFYRLEIVGPEFYGSNAPHFIPFRALRILQLEKLPKWRTWITSELEHGAFPVLQELYLGECRHFIGELPVELPSLRKLEISDCKELKLSLPRLLQISKLKVQKCEQVNLRNLDSLYSLTSLDLLFDKGNGTFPSDLQRLTSLTDLRIAGYHSLCNVEELKFPSKINTLFLSQLSDHVGLSPSTSYGCDDLQSAPHLFRCIPPSITSLSIGGFKNLDLSPHSYMSLQRLAIHDCHFSRPSYFPLGRCPVLKYLEIKKCYNLESFDINSAEGHEICLTLLNELIIVHCPDLLHFSREEFLAPNLKTLSISECQNLLSVPEGMHTNLTSLQSLSLKDCPELDSFPKGVFPSNINTLSIRYCKRLVSRWKKWKLHQLVSLTRLEVHGFQDVECFPQQRWLPANLTSLVIAHFPNLIFLIGEALEHLTSLQELEIVYCPNLWSLPEGMPPSLKFLGIYFCPLLKQRCQRDKGEDWPKISHLPRINIDFEDI